MKTNLRFITTILFTLSFANLAQAQSENFVPSLTPAKLPEGINDLIPTVMAIPVSELLADTVITEVLKRATETIAKSQSSPDFRYLYWDARATILHGLYDHKLYDKVRTLIVTRMKNHLHQEGKIKQYYIAHRLKVLDGLKTLSADERGRLVLLLVSAERTFAKMKDPATVETFKHIDEMRTKVNREIMRENLSDEQVAQALLAGEDVGYWDFDDFRDQSLSSFPDIELAEFAWRRWSEGGEVLVNQYIEVIGMITEDLLSIK